jgi:hypothetical protein
MKETIMPMLKGIAACLSFVAVLILFISIILPTSKSSHLTKENDVKQEAFLNCSKDEGDAGCDSCYYLIYGVHLDTYSLYK